MIRMQFISMAMIAMTNAGELPTVPIIFPLTGITDYSITAKETSKETDFLGQCCGTNVVFGEKDVSGSMSGVLTSSTAAIVMQHMFGEFDSNVDATADAWATATVVAYGDIVNHTDGTHSLVCTKSGTTGATEPTIVGLNKKIVDGTANWSAVSLQKKGITNTSKKPRNAAIELKFKRDDGSFMYVRYENVTFSKTDIAAVLGDIDMKWNVDVIGARVTDALDDGFVALADMANAKTIVPFDDYYMNDEVTGGSCAYRDGVLVDDFEEMSFSIERKVEKSKAIAKLVDGLFVARPPEVSKDIKAKGKFMIYANDSDYENFKSHTPFDATVKLKNNLASEVTATFKDVVPGFSDISIEDCMDSKLESELFVTGGCANVAPVTIEVIYPQLVDTNGVVVNYFA